MWNMGANVAGQVAHYLEGTQVQEPGTTVMLSTYTLVHDHCGYTATPAMARPATTTSSARWPQGIGNFHVVFFLELDSLITAPCLNHRQLAIRDAELKYAVSVLEADPHVARLPGRGRRRRASTRPAGGHAARRRASARPRASS